MPRETRECILFFFFSIASFGNGERERESRYEQPRWDILFSSLARFNQFCRRTRARSSRIMKSLKQVTKFRYSLFFRIIRSSARVKKMIEERCLGLSGTRLSKSLNCLTIGFQYPNLACVSMGRNLRGFKKIERRDSFMFYWNLRNFLTIEKYDLLCKWTVLTRSYFLRKYLLNVHNYFPVYALSLISSLIKKKLVK